MIELFVYFNKVGVETAQNQVQHQDLLQEGKVAAETKTKKALNLLSLDYFCFVGSLIAGLFLPFVD